MKGHGGDIFEVCEKLSIAEDQLLDFSSNINPLGPPPQALEILAKSQPVVGRYPDVECRRLRRHLADHLGVGPERILVGNGSTELIYLIARRFAPRRATTFPPCYADYRRASELAGGDVAGYVATEDESFILSDEALENGCRSCDMVWIGNPSNPTGGVIDRERIRALAKGRADVLFVVDEAFMEFLPDCGERTLLGAPEPNILVLRSLTKFFALAGLRLGYLVAAPEVVRRLAAVKEPWTVNGLAQAVGEHLYDDPGYIERTRAVVKDEREFLMKELAGLSGPPAEATGKAATSLQPFASQANFLLVRLGPHQSGRPQDITSGGVKHQLLHHRILIRDASNFLGLDSRFFRVAVRTHEDNLKLVDALRQALAAAGS